MKLEEAQGVVKKLRSYKGQKCKPYDTEVTKGQIVPVDLEDFAKFVAQKGNGEMRIPVLFPMYDGDFTVIMIFDDEWCYYNQFVEANNISL